MLLILFLKLSIDPAPLQACYHTGGAHIHCLNVCTSSALILPHYRLAITQEVRTFVASTFAPVRISGYADIGNVCRLRV
jgi:hypothetical protein